MSPEHRRPSVKPYEVFGITEEEVVRWRVSDEKLKEILADVNTNIHTLELSSNNYGEFMFLAVSRGIRQSRTCMMFWGLGYHNYRERWIHDEWFWHQTRPEYVKIQNKLSLEETAALLEQRLAEIVPYFEDTIQTDIGKLFEELADLTDDDAVLSEFQDLGLL